MNYSSYSKKSGVRIRNRFGNAGAKTDNANNLAVKTTLLLTPLQKEKGWGDSQDLSISDLMELNNMAEPLIKSMNVYLKSINNLVPPSYILYYYKKGSEVLSIIAYYNIPNLGAFAIREFRLFYAKENVATNINNVVYLTNYETHDPSGEWEYLNMEVAAFHEINSTIMNSAFPFITMEAGKKLSRKKSTSMLTDLYNAAEMFSDLTPEEIEIMKKTIKDKGNQKNKKEGDNA